MRYLAILFFSISMLVCGQENQIRGVVKDAFDMPIAEVYVYNSNSKKHIHTLENGSFLLNHSQVGDTLKLRLLGFKPKDIILKEIMVSTNYTFIMEAAVFQLDEMLLTQSINPLHAIEKFDNTINPVNSSQELLQRVPGLFIGQHAGGGKAEQIFLRGFDVDHGTDVSISVDGMPVNMVSHAHGQGYADLHFVIPETMERMTFDKGPYFATQGNFNTAGYIAFQTTDRFDENKIKVEVGDFNTLRTVGLFNLSPKKANEQFITAVEYMEGDGPFVSPQNFNRFNLFGKYQKIFDTQQFEISASHFNSRWDASGQIPERAVAQGLISRFGAIDDTEGGETSRTNLNASFTKYISANSTFKTQAYLSAYDFLLFSNFTFFLNDPINGDQIKQKESRNLMGFTSTLVSTHEVGNTQIETKAGFGLRYDAVDGIELSETLNRKTVLEYVKLGAINETNVFSFLEAEVIKGKFTITPGVRLDYFKNIYEDDLSTTYESNAATETLISPKLRLDYAMTSNMNLFFKAGMGFHSNDTRVVVAQKGKETLPKATGADVGIYWKPVSKVFISSALWLLDLEQEFVYVGDAGVVEPSGATRRLGADFSARYQMNDWLFLDSDFTYTYARSKEAETGADYIPLAPKITAAGGLGIDNLQGFSGGIRYRYLGDRAANEDNSIIAKGYFVTDTNISYAFRNITLGVSIDNVFDVAWNETQFATTSRLANEIESVEEIHFTPGTSRFLKASITYTF
ncbi:TonB-dependent receptor [Aquimarina sp. W85]|uniref:TonB-dependent receptor n=1 Tax=Aquimarina rhodophyticola TaxID=3342246 RepID=UPI003671F6EF